MMNAQELIDFYSLQVHPEGGYYKQSYRSDIVIDKKALPATFNGSRLISTAIYFLLPAGSFAAFHRIKSDELWHFYAGKPLHIHVIHPDGRYELLKLGSDFNQGQSYQLKVPAGVWFASEPSDKNGFSFVGCTVSPGFDFSDFEMASSSQLVEEYPDLRELVSRLCR
jgi:predicted cupin superfamily sugar epimerase